MIGPSRCSFRVDRSGVVVDQIVCMFREDCGNLDWTSLRCGLEASFRTKRHPFVMFRRWIQALVPVAIMQIGGPRP